MCAWHRMIASLHATPLRASARISYDTKTSILKCFVVAVPISDNLSDLTWFLNSYRSSSTISISLFLTGWLFCSKSLLFQSNFVINKHQYVIETFAMAASKKPRGRPRRTEDLKVIYLRKSVQEQWRSKKNFLGYEKLTNSEFAEVLLQ